MFYLRIFLCLLIVLSLAATIIFCQSFFPLKTDTLISEKYSGWSGVIRAWIYEGWKTGSGSSSGWLNFCANSFEKNYEGVYVQIQYVDESAISNLCENGVIPPDVVFFPPELIDTPNHFVPLETEKSLRSSLINAGVYNGIIYSHPVLMGGYIWVYNPLLLESIPSSWENTSAPVAVPNKETYRNWSAALLGLCSSPYYKDSGSQLSASPDHSVDLGLSIDNEEPIPTATVSPDPSDLSYCRLSDSFLFTNSAYSDFVNEKVAVIPVTQREIYRLEQRADQGKGPDWQISITGDIAFSDQLLYAAIVDKPDNVEKQNLCNEFITHLLSEECQNQLYRIGAFSVTQSYSGYPGYSILTSLEYILRSKDLYIVPAFKNKQSEYLDSIVQRFIQNKGFSEQLLHEFSSCAR